MGEESKLIDELLDNLIQSPTRPEEIQVCPICGGKLHVGFGAYKRFGESLFGASVDCESCGIAMAVDYGIAPPPWLVSD
jgi:hypothetical protein